MKVFLLFFSQKILLEALSFMCLCQKLLGLATLCSVPRAAKSARQLDPSLLDMVGQPDPNPFQCLV